MLNIKSRSIAGTVALVATVVTIAAATPLRAEPVRTEVSYGDIDLHSAEGRAVLQSRLIRASKKVCSYDEPAGRIAAAQCRQNAMASAQAQLAQVVERGHTTAKVR